MLCDRSAGRYCLCSFCRRMDTNAPLSHAQHPGLDCRSFTTGDVLWRYIMGCCKWRNGYILPTHMGLFHWILLEWRSHDTNMCVLTAFDQLSPDCTMFWCCPYTNLLTHFDSCLLVDLAVLAGLQALCIIWLFDIAKGVYAFVIYGEADDHRSDDDEEDESRETAATKKEF